MDVERYLRSLGQEVMSLQQRVRYILADAHWQTDGEWKESVVRQVLRRYLPTAVHVSRGFVVTSDVASTQIDILLHDASKPVLFKDGDLVFVTPDAVLGLIEIKARVGRSKFREALDKLCLNAELVRLHPNTRAFVAFFAFELEGDFSASWLVDVANAAPTWNHRLNFAAIGDSGFIRYWDEDPANPNRSYESWHAYALPGLAASYFVHNAVDAVSPNSVLRNNDVWYPRAGKEPQRLGVEAGRWKVS
jgi:hypothetical protein